MPVMCNSYAACFWKCILLCFVFKADVLRARRSEDGEAVVESILFNITLSFLATHSFERVGYFV